MKKLGFGLMRLPQKNGEIDMELFKKMTDEFMAQGGTYFDTAYPYHGGKSETAFKEAVVERYPRDSFTVTDKLPMFSINKTEQLQPIFDEQLSRCGVDYFDYYWLHALNKHTYEISKNIGAFDFVRQKKAEGKIHHLGFSFHDSAEALDMMLSEQSDMEYVQLQINYLDWEDKGVQARECYEVARRHGKEIIIMEPIKGGALANIPDEAKDMFLSADPNLSVASWAVRYTASLDGVIMVLSGMSNMEQMKDNLSYMMDFKPLSQSETDMCMKVADIIRNSIAVPCTDCKYCVDGCPKKIAIPDYFRCLNDLKRYGSSQKPNVVSRYNDILKDHSKASECIKCGKCEKVCPQHLNIREYLDKVSVELE